MKIVRLVVFILFVSGAFGFAADGKLIQAVSEWNVSGQHLISGVPAELAGEVEELTDFKGGDNPFEWASWPDVPYLSTVVESDVLIARAGESGTSPMRLLSATLAWWLDMDEFRYLELEFERELSVGDGKLWFRKNGNSVVTSGQHGSFRISDSFHGERVRIILDLKEIPAWELGAFTGLGLDLHVGTGASKNNTTDRLFRIRIATELRTLGN